MDFAAFIDRIDRPGVLFYLDPPYYGCEDDYGRELFSRARFDELAEQLARLKGRFILSLNDRPEVREIFGQFEITEVKTTYSIAAKGALAERGEVLITSTRTR